MSNQIRFLDTETKELGKKLIRGEEVTLSDGSALLMGTNDFVLVPEEDGIEEEAEARANEDYKLQTQINEVKATAETAKSIANQAIDLASKQDIPKLYRHYIEVNADNSNFNGIIVAISYNNSSTPINSLSVLGGGQIGYPISIFDTTNEKYVGGIIVTVIDEESGQTIHIATSDGIQIFEANQYQINDIVTEV